MIKLGQNLTFSLEHLSRVLQSDNKASWLTCQQMCFRAIIHVNYSFCYKPLAANISNFDLRVSVYKLWGKGQRYRSSLAGNACPSSFMHFFCDSFSCFGNATV